MFFGDEVRAWPAKRDWERDLASALSTSSTAQLIQTEPMCVGCCLQENGFCLSYVFKVHDLQARGFVRWYGVLFLAPQASLLASTDFLVGFVLPLRHLLVVPNAHAGHSQPQSTCLCHRSVKGVVHDLQEQSAIIFEKEKEEKEKQAQVRCVPNPSSATEKASHVSHARLT
jgi:hypothetical protein